jgi:hypothetical protein
MYSFRLLCNHKGKVKYISSIPFLGAIAKLRLATIIFIMSICPSVRMEQLDPPLDGF